MPLTLEQALLAGMDNFKTLTDAERNLVEKNKIEFVNVHRVPLKAHLEQWQKGAWFILKPRFIAGIIDFDRSQLKTLISSVTGINPIEIADHYLEEFLIKNESNSLVFCTFIMLKILKERLPTGDVILPNNPDYQLITDWKKAVPSKEALFFDILLNIIAQVAINSTLESIAFDYAIEQKGFDKTQIYNPAYRGCCNLSPDDFDKKIMAFDREELLKIGEIFHKYKEQYYLAVVFSGLIDAIIEKKPNNFLACLKLKNTSTQQEINRIETVLEAERIQEQQKAENKRFAAPIKVKLVQLAEHIAKTCPVHNAKIEHLQTILETNFSEFENGNMDKKRFIDASLATIKYVMDRFKKETKTEWYTPIINLLKKIANFFIGLVNNRNDNPNRFFKIPGEELNGVNELAADFVI